MAQRANRNKVLTIEKFRQSRDRFNLLQEAVETIRDYAIFMLDADGYILTWNNGAERIKGYKDYEVIGEHFSLFYTPEDKKKRHPQFELKEAKKFGRYEEEGWRIRKDGTRFWAGVVITKITDRQGNLVGFSKVTRDLTERRRAEDAIRNTNKELEKRVEERTEELMRANEKLRERQDALKEAVRVRDEFLSIASHELKTPVTSLKLQIQMLKQKTKPELGQMPPPEKIAGFLDSSLNQINRLNRLIEDLLDAVRFQAQKLAFRFETVDLESLVKEVLSRLAMQLQASENTIELGISGDVSGIFDRGRIDQVLENLLTNAMKYAPKTAIRVLLEGNADTVLLKVRDQGPGIAAADQEKIFERFERTDQARNISGLGLGLFISQGIVAGHGGRIKVKSELGRGAEFIVELPRNPPQERSTDRGRKE